MKTKSIILGALLFSWFLIHSIIITVDGLNDDVHHADYVLILGNTVNPDGTLSARLKARVDKGLQLFNDSLADTIIVSGGLGVEGHYEARKMKQYLIDSGVEEKHIIVDDLGINTVASARNFVKITNGNDKNSVVVVSQFFHITRTKYILRKLGVENVYGA
ncbi:MAG TPA: YdcF family protein, partial [Cyclobacteriaceae bacterium]